MTSINDTCFSIEGQYCIVPSTYDANEEGEFILRLFSEKPASNVEENDDELAIDESVGEDKDEVYLVVAQ